jgi:hypothetical protein
MNYATVIRPINFGSMVLFVCDATWGGIRPPRLMNVYIFATRYEGRSTVTNVEWVLR